MTAQQKSVDLDELVDAKLTDLGNGLLNLDFPKSDISFDFKLHNDTSIFEAMKPRGLYFLGTYYLNTLFVEYLGESKQINFACIALNQSVELSYPGEKVSFLPIQVVDVTERSALIVMCHRPKERWVLSLSQDGSIDLSHATNN